MALPRFRLAASFAASLTLNLCAIACVTPAVNLVPTDGSVPPGDEISIEAGTSIKIIGVDGEAIETNRVLVAPGEHAIEYQVRRNLRTVNDMMDGVYHSGECRLKVDAKPGEAYRVRIAALREVAQWKGSPGGIDATYTSFGTNILLENQTTGDKGPLSCELIFDCRRLKDTTRRSNLCQNG